jgi:hypothetical protein
MQLTSMTRYAGAMLFLLAVPLATAAQVHEHGTATLEIAVDGGVLSIALESPLENLVGFEHAPRDDRQRAALKKMEDTLRRPERLFKPAPEAGCVVRDVKVENPFAEGSKPESGHAHGAEAKHGGHADEQHAEAHAAWTFKCSRPQALRTLEVLLFDAFPAMKRIKTQKATPSGQSGATLTPKRRSIAL